MKGECRMSDKTLEINNDITIENMKPDSYNTAPPSAIFLTEEAGDE